MDSRQEQFHSAYDKAKSATELGRVALGFSKEWCDFANHLQPAEAIGHLEILLSATQNNSARALALNEIGRIHAGSGNNNAALGYFKQANQLSQNHPGILSNIGLANRWMGNLSEAERWLRRALILNPWEANAALEMSFIKLLQGDYSAGFEHYESRFRMPGGSLKKLECDKPEWDGTNGKNVFIYGEQGSGDIFLMLRYAKLIKERGVKQSWVVHKAMLPLVSTMNEIDFVFSDGDKTPVFDCHLPAASLPRLFKTSMNNIPNPLCLPRPKPHDFGEGFHVGIVWRGSAAQNNDKIRSTNLGVWQEVLDVTGVKFHSLQVDGSDEALFYPAINVLSRPQDWMETARRACGLDLVISVDTSMVHLCGSLGVPCWCALHCRPYFAFPLVRDDCPWYPSVKLFKQKKEFEWQPVFSRIANELKTLLPRPA